MPMAAAADHPLRSAQAAQLTGQSCTLEGGIAGQPRTVRVSEQKFALEDDIGSHACSLEVLASV
jgi:hypothetical protein